MPIGLLIVIDERPPNVPAVSMYPKAYLAAYEAQFSSTAEIRAWTMMQASVRVIIESDPLLEEAYLPDGNVWRGRFEQDVRVQNALTMPSGYAGDR